MMALTSAQLGGLDVRLLVPRMSDSRLVTWRRVRISTTCYTGRARLRYGPRLLHTKRCWSRRHRLIGSANFDHRSFRLNFEVSMLFHDATIAAELAQLIEGEFAHAPRVREDRKRVLWRDRLPEALARLLSPLM